MQVQEKHCAICRNDCTLHHARSGNGPICYNCCADLDKQEMIKSGNSKKVELYLNTNEKKVTNWPGTLSFNIRGLRKGKHNIARTRYDIWFNGPDNFIWHGVNYGEFTQIVHCKRTAQKAENNA